jgi:hypothetical protein
MNKGRIGVSLSMEEAGIQAFGRVDDFNGNSRSGWFASYR